MNIIDLKIAPIILIHPVYHLRILETEFRVLASPAIWWRSVELHRGVLHLDRTDMHYESIAQNVVVGTGIKMLRHLERFVILLNTTRAPT